MVVFWPNIVMYLPTGNIIKFEIKVTKLWNQGREPAARIRAAPGHLGPSGEDGSLGRNHLWSLTKAT